MKRILILLSLISISQAYGAYKKYTINGEEYKLVELEAGKKGSVEGDIPLIRTDKGELIFRKAKIITPEGTEGVIIGDQKTEGDLQKKIYRPVLM